MTRIAPLIMLLACSRPAELATIEEAEVYAQAHGVTLTEKTEDKYQIVAQRAYHYMANGSVKCAVFQFASASASQAWKKAMDDAPLGGETIIQKGPVAFSVWGSTDADRQKVIGSLK